jgi:hypothetical protein
MKIMKVHSLAGGCVAEKAGETAAKSSIAMIKAVEVLILVLSTLFLQR